MNLKIIIPVILVLAGAGFIINGSEFTASVFDSSSCELQKVNISGQVYSSESELEEDVLANGGEAAWNDIQENVASWETQNGELYFRPVECDQVVD
jgi:hypothetical protein